MKNFTNIEQSKKLAEILPLKTADMIYIPSAEYKNGNTFYTAIFKSEFIYSEDCIPCWSLSALLKVMPEEVHLVGSSIQSYWYCECVDSNVKSYLSKSADNPVDACVDMIVKLKEQKLL